MRPQNNKTPRSTAACLTRQEEAAVRDFLKLALSMIAAGGFAYLLVYLKGERGLRAATDASAGLMYGMAALIVVFGVAVVGFSIAKPRR